MVAFFLFFFVCDADSRSGSKGSLAGGVSGAVLMGTVSWFLSFFSARCLSFVDFCLNSHSSDDCSWFASLFSGGVYVCVLYGWC